MAIVTLTTDLDWNSGELGLMKGMILSDSPKANIVDISHTQHNYNLNAIAYKLKDITKYFRKGTVHLIYYYIYYHNTSKFVVAKYREQYFICPQNGILDLIFKDNAEYYSLADTDTLEMWPGELFARTAAKLSEGFKPKEIGKKFDSTLRKTQLRPVVNKNNIRATVVHIDTFGNVILNVDRQSFQETRKKRAFSIYYQRYDPIEEIVDHYGQVETGIPLARFNRHDSLEIAINMESAAKELKLSVNDMIQIQFHDYD